MKQSLVVVGVNHRTAPVELRERLAVPSDGLEQTVKGLAELPHVREAMVVATCNRVEVYVATDSPTPAAAEIRGYFAAKAPGSNVDSSLYEHYDGAAIRHVFRVACSLESMVVGEPQILGQVKEAYAAARAAGTVGPELNKALSRAFSAAKRVRTETGIATGSVSVASVAVDLAVQIFGELTNRQVLLVGAGKMALGATRALMVHGAKLSIANRNYQRAVELARERNAQAHSLEALPLLLTQADVVICSTGATRYVITPEMVQSAMKVRRGKSLFIVDIAVPRNVDPRVNGQENVYLFDVDDLEREVARAIANRGGSLTAAEKIVEEEIRAFESERKIDSVVPTITALREHFRLTARAELERSLGGKLKHLGPEDRKALESMLDAVTNKLLHTPTTTLRAQSKTADGLALATVTRMLFGLTQSDNHNTEPETSLPSDAASKKAKVQ